MAHNATTTREGTRAYWALALPAFALYVFVMAFPIGLSIVLSLSDYSGGKMFGGQPWGIAGFGQYAKLFSDPFFWYALKNNMYIVATSVLGQIPLGFAFAYAIYRKIVKAPGFWQGILYLPNIISIIVVGLLWSTIFSPFGPISEFMNGLQRGRFMDTMRDALTQAGGFGVERTQAAWDALVSRITELAGAPAAALFPDAREGVARLLAGYGAGDLERAALELTNLFAPRWTPDFLNQRDWAMIPVMFVILWMWTGTYVIIFLANMQKIDPAIIEAARIDGAGEGLIMTKVILPSMTGVIVNSTILAIAGSLNSFGLVYAMTGGGPARVTEILAIYMYQNAFRARPNYPLANAIALVMVIVSVILIALTKLAERALGSREE